ncbi:lamin tail domain-containing protein [Catellatospora sp. NPDC049609]|uniref:lamin tail domain-containing protein n=1 Tax=Catellatospora sp. NPDC049609 TaxID=3155505 RepID=UPI0034275C09
MRHWVRRAALPALVGMSASVLGLGLSSPAQAVSPDIVISQVYGGGGNDEATYTRDFIELYNRGTTAVSVTGWSVQYAGAAGSSWAVTSLTGTIEPGRYYLVAQAQGAGGSTPLPTPDASGATAMSASSGKVALVTTTIALTCSTGCDTAAGVRDFVGYGAANSFEAAPAPGLSNTTAAFRVGQGSVDTDNNSTDFYADGPRPRNSAFVSEADLVVTKSDRPDPVASGQQVTYTIELESNGPDAAQGVELVDAVPAGTTFVSATAEPGWALTTPAVGGTGEISAAKSSVADGEDATFELVVLVDAGATGPLSNTAKVSSTTFDPDLTNNAATATTTVQQQSADLAITKADRPDPVIAGGRLEYDITVSNGGPAAAQNVTFTDAIPANTTFASLTVGSTGWTVSTPPVGGTGTVTARRASMPATGGDATTTFTLAVIVNAGATGTITNISGVTSTTPDPNTSNNGDRETTTIAAAGPRCTITGTQRNDVLNGTPGADVICGLGGNDIINGQGGNDTVYGGPGRDLISGGSGFDTVYGEDGNDIISVSDRVRGNDTADGGPGFDLCSADPLDGVVSCP